MVLGKGSGSFLQPQCRQTFGKTVAGQKKPLLQTQSRVTQPPSRLAPCATQSSQGGAVAERESTEPVPSVSEGQSVSSPKADAVQGSIPKPSQRKPGPRSQMRRSNKPHKGQKSSVSSYGEEGIENGIEPEQSKSPPAKFVVIENAGKPVPPEAVSFKERELVLGRVISEDRNKGWRIQLVDHPDILGICPPMYKPYTLKDSLANFKVPPGSVGLVRQFEVDKIPSDMVYGGKGPVLNALVVDQATIWRRAQQIQEIHSERLDTLAVTIRATNEAGLLGVWDGIPLFLPWKFSLTYTKRPSQEDKQMLADQLISQKKTYVSIVDVLQERNRFVGNLIEANQIRALEGVQIGDLIEAKIVNVASYGVFLRTQVTQSMKGLLHIRNISQAHAGDLNSTFKIGDTVKAYVSDVDEKNQVEFSTMEMETYAGEMLEAPEVCYARAESLGPWQELRDQAIAAKQEATRSKRGQKYEDDRGYNSRQNSPLRNGDMEVWRSRDDLDTPPKGGDLDW